MPLRPSRPQARAGGQRAAGAVRRKPWAASPVQFCRGEAGEPAARHSGEFDVIGNSPAVI